MAFKMHLLLQFSSYWLQTLQIDATCSYAFGLCLVCWSAMFEFLIAILNSRLLMHKRTAILKAILDRLLVRQELHLKATWSRLEADLKPTWNRPEADLKRLWQVYFFISVSHPPPIMLSLFPVCPFLHIHIIWCVKCITTLWMILTFRLSYIDFFFILVSAGVMSLDSLADVFCII